MQGKEYVMKARVFNLDKLIQHVCANANNRYNGWERDGGWTPNHGGPMEEIWNTSMQIIEDNLMIGKSTHIQDFGTFTYRNKDSRKSGHLVKYERGHVNYIPTPVFKVDEKLEKDANVRSIQSLEIPGYLGSIWQSQAKPVFLNTFTVAKKLNQERRYVDAVIIDLVRGITDCMSTLTNAELDCGFCTLFYDDKTRVVSLKPKGYFYTAFQRAQDLQQDRNLHAVNPKNLLDGPRPISQVWRRDRDERRREVKAYLGRPRTAPPGGHGHSPARQQQEEFIAWTKTLGNKSERGTTAGAATTSRLGTANTLRRPFFDEDDLEEEEEQGSPYHSPRPGTPGSRRPGTASSRRPGTASSRRPGTASSRRPGLGRSDAPRRNVDGNGLMVEGGRERLRTAGSSRPGTAR